MANHHLNALPARREVLGALDAHATLPVKEDDNFKLVIFPDGMTRSLVHVGSLTSGPHPKIVARLHRRQADGASRCWFPP